jgi:hypothetical protein
VRLKCALGIAALFASAWIASAQNPDAMMPEANEAKARQILKDLVDEMGGPAYESATQRQCDGRRAQFGHSGDLTGYIPIKEYWNYPDKQLTEYIAKGHNTLLGYMIGVTDLDLSHGGTVITLFNGDRGWTMSKGGVEEMPPASVEDFQEAAKRNIDNLLRFGLKEKGVSVRFAGMDIVDLRPADWVEIRDTQDRIYRLAVERSTHLLIRSVVSTVNQEMGERVDDTTIYTNYQRVGGLYVPMQITRERNGRKYYQAFFDSCNFNPGLPADFFTKEGLQDKFAHSGYKKEKDKYKNAKD